MALTNATTLADYGAGIGTQGAALTVDATNKRVGVGTDAPAGPEGSLQVGTGITFFGNTGIVSAIGGRFSGDFSVAGALTFEDVTNIDSLGFGTFRSGLTVQGAGSTTTTLNVTGVATVSNNISIGDSIFHIGDGGGTTFGFPAADTFTVYTGGSERLRANSSGNIGINSTIPRSKLHVANGNSNYNPGNPTGLGAGAVASLESNSDVALQFLTSTTTDNFIYFGDTDSATTGSIQYDHNTNALSFNVNGGTERLRIDSSGRVLVGNTQDSSPFSWGLGLQVSGTSTNAGLSIRRDQNTSGGALLMFVKSRGSLNGNTVVQDGDQIGGMYFNAADGTDVNSYAAQIAAEIDGTPGSNDVPGRLKFSTTADGAASPTERLRIASSGQIGLGGANYGTSGQVLTSNGSSAAVTWEDASGGGGITTQVGNASGIVTSMFLTDAIDHKITATGICTITTTQAGIEGQSHTIRIVNSGVANVGFSTYFLFPSGSTPSLPTADGAVSLISFTVHDSVGAGCTQLLAGASVNFS
jgi:hypothetical protein